MNKKIIYIVAGLLALSVITVLVIILIMPTKRPVLVAPSQNHIEYSALGVQTDQNNNLIYFNPSDKNFYKNSQKILSLNFDPFTLVYSRDYTEVLLIGDINHPGKTMELLNLSNGQKKSLDQHIINAAFSPDGGRLVYHWYDPVAQTSVIKTSNLDGSSEQTIYDPGFLDGVTYALRWPQLSSIIVLPIWPEVVKVKLLSINPQTKDVTILGQDNFLDVIPDYSGDLLAATVYNGQPNQDINKNSFLEILDAGGTAFKTQVQTNSQQITWARDDSKVYAIGAVLGKLGLYTADRKGAVTEVPANLPAHLDINQMVVSNDSKKILYINAGQMQEIPIP